ncbi:MAG TPA: adenylate/guanylate cyclase domain-containing protein [Acidimicrobiales bacterium]|nr:adenylate/guanylate cyclase domain-containing protein [Acidimicrobiales bacterium]
MSSSSAVTNLGAAAAAFAFVAWVLPSEPLDDPGRVLLVNTVLVSVWAPLAVAAGTVWGARVLAPARRWLVEGRDPSTGEVGAVLRTPRHLLRVQLLLWMASAGLFGLVNGLFDPRLISRVAFTVVLSGLSAGAVTYLTTERIMRPVAARALAQGDVDRPRLPGVALRQVLAWALGTGVPLLGLVVTGVFALAEGTATRTSLAVTMVVIGGVALGVGLWVTLLGARAVADPVREVRQGMARVGDGDLDVAVDVYDASELGLLQDGFNRMVDGLREREQLRELFGRHVGEDVAQEALGRGPGLGGEVRDVAVLFVDIIDSTGIAAGRPATDVVDVLNRFFTVVVSTVDEHGGWINKFQGDAALAVFGAPGPRADPAGAALAAARHLATRLAAEVPDCRAGIGVAAGPAVAGNIGSEERFEYTVIGDPVNEAARLTELAKDVPGLVLASGEAVAAAGGTEADHWRAGERVTLRGRRRPTVLHVPAGAPSGATALGTAVAGDVAGPG